MALRRRNPALVAYALMAPSLVLVLGVFVYPVGWMIHVSLTNFSTEHAADARFVGLVNYVALGRDPAFWGATATTLAYFLSTLVAKLALGLALALLLARPAPGRALAFIAVFLPWAYPGGVTVISWYWLLNPPLTTSYSVALGDLKHRVDAVIGSGAYAFLSVMLFNVWRGGSFTAVFLLAGLNSIPAELLEYARFDTTSAAQRLWRVTLPLMRPYLALAVLFTTTMALSDLANVWMLTGGRVIFPVLGTQAYWLAIQQGRFAAAAARSVAAAALFVPVVLIVFRWLDRPEEDGR